MKSKLPQSSVKKRQKITYYVISFIFIVSLGAVSYFIAKEDRPQRKLNIKENAFQVTTDGIKPENIRISNLENFNTSLYGRMEVLEKQVIMLKDDNQLLNRENTDLEERLDTAYKNQQEQNQKFLQHLETRNLSEISSQNEKKIQEWRVVKSDESRHASCEIPAGTVVKAVLVSGADCSVGIHKPTGPNMVLLQPLANGRLPRRVKVPLKGSVIIGNAVGDISSERVFIRAERLTLVQKNGDFVETEVSAYISGEDGREGMRGIVVDKSGSIITRAGFASFLQGVGQGIQATLGNQTLEKLARVSSEQSILNLDLARTAGFQGTSTALNKMADYYIKRAEQLQPTIQIAAGRIVDVIFTKTVKLGESDLKKRIQIERNLSSKGLS
ncbi:MAG: TraB/VirB10 family protein [Rhabdochlamydiaceae bacterium]|nr:TraB/VirB10 family protein [Candidatus Amphrikana amoebophyrae]